MVSPQNQQTYKIVISLLLATAALKGASVLAEPNPKSNEFSELALQDEPSSLNLRSILEHQEAIELACARLHDRKLRELELLIKFNDKHENLHLPAPLTVKVPAVCLFLFGDSYDTFQMAGRPSKARKLDIVNWIYNEDEIRRQMANATVKREALGSGDEQKEAEGAMEMPTNEREMNDILHEFLYQPPSTNSSTNSKESEAENEINLRGLGGETRDFSYEDRSKNELHENIERMLETKEFKEMIEGNRDRIGQSLSPVILIPGLLGSRLQARVSKKPKRVNIFCSKHSDWQEMWLSMRRLLPLAVDCWLDNVRLEFEPSTGFTRNPEGVESRVADFGSVESVRYLDVNQPGVTKYMASLIERYEKLGYTPGQNLLAAPYDFRLAPQQLYDTYFQQLKQLIEEAHRGQNGGWLKVALGSEEAGRKVTLVCHSMGCTHALIFLRRQSATWRQSRIKKLIALSSPWGGSIKSLKALVVGDQLDLPLISEAKMRKLARTYPSIAYLLPQAEVFNKPNKYKTEPRAKPLVETPQKSYSLNELPELLSDLQLFKQLSWFNITSSLIRPFEPLEDLKVDCIHSLNAPTPETLQFTKQRDFPDGDYNLIKGDGDGTVNFESLMVCADWAAKLPDKVVHKIILNTNHIGVLSHKAVLSHLTHDAYLALYPTHFMIGFMRFKKLHNAKF